MKLIFHFYKYKSGCRSHRWDMLLSQMFSNKAVKLELFYGDTLHSEYKAPSQKQAPEKIGSLFL